MPAICAARFRTLQLLACALCWLVGCQKPAAPAQSGVGPQPSVDQDSVTAVAQSGGSDRRKPVARVLGKEVFDEDLAPPANSESQRSLTNRELKQYRQGKLGSLIWEPLMEKYCRDHQIEATDEEIEQYKRSDIGKALSTHDVGAEFRDDLRKSLDAGEIDDDEKDELSELATLLEADSDENLNERLFRYYRSKLKANDLGDEKKQAFAEMLATLETMQNWPGNAVKAWKFDRALYAQYGGTVIFQQANPFEPVEAYRQWLEAAERAGEFAIFDEPARTAFWDYYQRGWDTGQGVVHDPDPFDKPWWLKKPREDASKSDE